MDIFSAYIEIKEIDAKEKLEGVLKELSEGKVDMSELYELLKDRPFVDRHFLISGESKVREACWIVCKFLSCFSDVHILVIWRNHDDFGRAWWNYSDWLSDHEDEDDKELPQGFDGLFSIDEDDEEVLDPSGWFSYELDKHENEPREWIKDAEELEECLQEISDEWDEFAEKIPEAWNAFVDALGDI